MERRQEFVQRERMFANVNAVVSETRRKLESGEKLTQADLKAIKIAAKDSSRPDHISLYAHVKAVLSAQDAKITEEEKEAAKPTPAERIKALEKAVEDARENAIRFNSIEARVAYVNAKSNLALELEISEVAKKARTETREPNGSLFYAYKLDGISEEYQLSEIAVSSK